MATEKKNSFETKLERLEEISKNLEKDTKFTLSSFITLDSKTNGVIN